LRKTGAKTFCLPSADYIWPHVMNQRLREAVTAHGGSIDRTDVIAALDHGQINEGPGGPAAMVPGQHHVRMNMYIAQARAGRFEIVERLGAIDPQERLVATSAVAV
jgi:hypothetical protein